MSALPRGVRLTAAIVWAVALAAGVIWAYTQNISPPQIVAWIYRSAREHPWAPFAYIFLYAIRPLTFMPAMWLTIASGSLFGFWHGVLLTIVGENTSANSAYAIARFFRKPADMDAQTQRELSPFRRTLQEQAIPTVIVLRAAYLPFDLVNYGCGLLRVPWWPYFIGTFIGILPPMITFVSFGASVDFNDFVRHLDNFNPGQLFDTRQLLISGGLLLASGLIAWYAHRRRARISRVDASVERD